MANCSSFPPPVRPALLARLRPLSCGRGERARIPAPLGPLGVALTFLLVLTLALHTAAPIAAKPGSGNSPNAKLCQKGGYATLARQEDPHTAFATEEACVSYAAKGGTLTAYVPPLSAGCSTLNDPGYDGSYVSIQTHLLTFKAGETISVTAGEPTEADGEWFFLVAGAAAPGAFVPDTVTHTFAADQSLQVRWQSDAFPPATITWTVSCGR